VQLSRTNKKWISIDVRIRPVFPDLVTNTVNKDSAVQDFSGYNAKVFLVNFLACY